MALATDPAVDETGVEVGLPPALHASGVVQYCPSSQATPVRADHEVVLADGRHSWQAFAGLIAPASTHAPPMRQPAETGCTQVSAISSHESVVQLSASAQSIAAPDRQVPPLQASPAVQNIPSLHGSVLVDQAVVLRTGSHSSHGFAGFASPALRQTPAIRHRLAISMLLQAPPLHVSVVQASMSLQSAVPEQVAHAPEMHERIIGQTTPQPPQLVSSVARRASQPVAAKRSQSS